ncbi:MAG: ATP-dependent helicase C-terminal domain-containing protein, partial [Paracoccaceae bacterium]
ANVAALARIRAEAKRLAGAAPAPVTTYGWAEMAALAYPDRIGLRRPGDAPRYVLSGGKGAALPDSDPLAATRLIIALDLDGDAREARIRLAAAITESELRGLYADRIGWQQTCEWSRREGRVVAREQELFGALVLADRIWNDAPPEAIARAALDGVRDLGLPLGDAARRFRARVELVRASGVDLPDMTDAALMQTIEHWLLPHLSGTRTATDIRRLDLAPVLRARLTWDQTQLLDRLAPAGFTTPMGRRAPIDYSGDAPEISVRLQEMFGVTMHPVVASQPLRITLLSPAGRPVQTTMDLPGFWATSYLDARKDMRGRYPKHAWPEDPTVAEPTLRAKPRGT